MQRSFDDLGTPLAEVTFCVVDLETTGGTAQDGGITEIGAVKVRGGETLATFQTFVNPGHSIPTQIAMLTGITDVTVRDAPPPRSVLPAFLEFVGDAVIVGHNVQYDLGYLNVALERSGHPRLANQVVDTLRLSRRLIREEAPNCKLSTLAQYFRLEHQPSHRALDDALATADLLHLLFERASSFGVCGLADLTSLPSITSHPQAAKLALTNNLPRKPGVYLFRDRSGTVLYVGKASNLRSRVRSYFSSDDRRKVAQLLREMHRVDHVVCTSPLEAGVLEVRLIHRLEPRFNQQAKSSKRYAYVKFKTGTSPKLSAVKTTSDAGAIYLGPFTSTNAARKVIEALQAAAPLNRLSTDPKEQAKLIERGLTTEPSVLLQVIESKMHALAAQEMFEQAADMRDRGEALSNAIKRQRRFDLLLNSGRVVIEIDGKSRSELVRGRLQRSWAVSRSGIYSVPLPLDLDPKAPDSLLTAPGQPLPTALADELTCVAQWLQAQSHRVRVIESEGPLIQPDQDLNVFCVPSANQF